MIYSAQLRPAAWPRTRALWRKPAPARVRVVEEVGPLGPLHPADDYRAQHARVDLIRHDHEVPDERVHLRDELGREVDVSCGRCPRAYM